MFSPVSSLDIQPQHAKATYMISSHVSSLFTVHFYAVDAVDAVACCMLYCNVLRSPGASQAPSPWPRV